MFAMSRVQALLMTLLPMTLVALSTSLGQSSAADVGGEQRVVRSTVLMGQSGSDVSGNYTFYGSVGASDERCWVRRPVSLSTTTFDGETVVLGKKRTNRTGRFNFTINPFEVPNTNGNYTVSVERLRIGGKRPITCSAASKTVQ